MSKKDQKILQKLMIEYNNFSELVALNYQQKAEEGILQWNRGSLNTIEIFLKDFAELCGVKLVYTFGTHPFLNRELEYRTVHLEGEDTKYHITRYGFQK